MVRTVPVYPGDGYHYTSSLSQTDQSDQFSLSPLRMILSKDTINLGAPYCRYILICCSLHSPEQRNLLVINLSVIPLLLLNWQDQSIYSQLWRLGSLTEDSDRSVAGSCSLGSAPECRPCQSCGPSFVFIRTPPCQNMIYGSGETFLLYKNILSQDKLHWILTLAQLLSGNFNFLRLKPIISVSIYSPFLVKVWGNFDVISASGGVWLMWRENEKSW